MGPTSSSSQTSCRFDDLGPTSSSIEAKVSIVWNHHLSYRWAVIGQQASLFVLQVPAGGSPAAASTGEFHCRNFGRATMTTTTTTMMMMMMMMMMIYILRTLSHVNMLPS